MRRKRFMFVGILSWSYVIIQFGNSWYVARIPSFRPCFPQSEIIGARYVIGPGGVQVFDYNFLQCLHLNDHRVQYRSVLLIRWEFASWNAMSFKQDPNKDPCEDSGAGLF